ncbi:hypothetical protein BV25DRAFT_1921748 [Artomyces pyxidatus]|uniref:Uncharacterized protein n=1 Tax=Artomyces pyxidatus TaxID=48021 RepID=A0ACB8SG32_9AGAM|nr:hypothetical protein BV25DRAFT_1921748 [Artomyces pyxidatus]
MSLGWPTRTDAGHATGVSDGVLGGEASLDLDLSGFITDHETGIHSAAVGTDNTDDSFESIGSIETDFSLSSSLDLSGNMTDDEGNVTSPSAADLMPHIITNAPVKISNLMDVNPANVLDQPTQLLERDELLVMLNKQIGELRNEVAVKDVLLAWKDVQLKRRTEALEAERKTIDTLRKLIQVLRETVISALNEF